MAWRSHPNETIESGLIAAVSVAAMLVSGCTPQQAAPFGKIMFGLMIVFLIGIPIAFWRAWRRRVR